MADCAKQEAGFEWRRGAKLGCGSFGTVWQGTAVSDGKIFAVKSAAEGSACASLLRREYQILNQFSSDRIIRSLGHDTTTEDGVLCYNLFLEFMAGGSVADAVKKAGGPLEESILRCYLRDVLEALQFVHEQGFVHGDIKGANVLISSDGRAKLADFGSATEIYHQLHKDLRMGGTPLWSAPETLVLGVQRPETDVWSVGCLVVEMATGRPPWSNIICSETCAASAMFKIACSGDVPCVPEGAVSAEAMDFLSKCLVRDVSARWSCKQLLSHPFVVCGDSFRESSSVVCFEAAPLSPVTPFDFASDDWNVSLSSSPSSSSGDRGLPDLGETCLEQQKQHFGNEDSKPKQGSCRGLSARDRIARLASGDLDYCEKAAAANVCAPQERKIGLFANLGLPEQWIQVRGGGSDCCCSLAEREELPKFDDPCSGISHGSALSSTGPSSVMAEPLPSQRDQIRCSSLFFSQNSIETSDYYSIVGNNFYSNECIQDN